MIAQGAAVSSGYAVRPASHSNQVTTKRLHVSNIPFKMNSTDLEFLFRQFGNVTEAEIISNEKGSKGFGFVTFARSLDAERAKSYMHHTVINGRVIEVNDALPRNQFRIVPSPALLRADARERNQCFANLSARHTLVPPHSVPAVVQMQRQQQQSSLPIDVRGPAQSDEWYKQLRKMITDRVQNSAAAAADLLTSVSSSPLVDSYDSSPDNEYRLFK